MFVYIAICILFASLFVLTFLLKDFMETFSIHREMISILKKRIDLTSDIRDIRNQEVSELSEKIQQFSADLEEAKKELSTDMAFEIEKIRETFEKITKSQARRIWIIERKLGISSSLKFLNEDEDKDKEMKPLDEPLSNYILNRKELNYPPGAIQFFFNDVLKLFQRSYFWEKESETADYIIGRVTNIYVALLKYCDIFPHEKIKDIEKTYNLIANLYISYRFETSIRSIMQSIFDKELWLTSDDVANNLMI